MVAAVILAVAGIGYFLFQQFFIAAPETGGPGEVFPGQRGIITNFGENILNDSRYTELVPYGGEPLNVNADDNPGQPNPFQ